MSKYGIGQPVLRFEDPRLLRGQGRYINDVNLPGQAYAVFVRSPHAHALIKSIDVEAARIVEPEVWIRADIEQHDVFVAAVATRDQNGEAMAAATQLVEHDLAFVSLELAAWRRSCGNVNHFGDLRHAGIDAR